MSKSFIFRDESDEDSKEFGMLENKWEAMELEIKITPVTSMEL